MKNQTREKFNGYLEQTAHLHGIADATKKFAATPSVQQKLESKIQESSEFLGKINLVGVEEQQGEKIGLDVGAPVSSTTNTDNNDRTTKDPSSLDNKGYHCQQIDFDTHITYQKLDMWAKFKDFQTRIRDLIIKRQALDRMMIGFNGTSRAVDSDINANPLLQDVAIGWLQKIRNDKPENVLAEVEAASNAIKIGDAAIAADGYKNLDALVMDLVNSMIDPWYRTGTDLVVIAGSKLVSDRYFKQVNVTQNPSEQLATDILMSTQAIGGLPAARVPLFPENKLLITSFDNLSVYYQEGARRRNIVENSKRNRIENYESSNDDFIVEDYGKSALAENIVLL